MKLLAIRLSPQAGESLVIPIPLPHTGEGAEAMPMSIDELKAGFFYSNGAYGRTWGVRQLAKIAADEKTGEQVIHFKGVAGTCRRKKGHCSAMEFARWAKYQVALHENDWKRVADDAPLPEAFRDA